jgi:hypothetical protein
MTYFKTAKSIERLKVQHFNLSTLVTEFFYFYKPITNLETQSSFFRKCYTLHRSHSFIIMTDITCFK